LERFWAGIRALETVSLAAFWILLLRDEGSVAVRNRSDNWSKMAHTAMGVSGRGMLAASIVSVTRSIALLMLFRLFLVADAIAPAMVSLGSLSVSPWPPLLRTGVSVRHE
jgi:hypothetical protein